MKWKKYVNVLAILILILALIAIIFSLLGSSLDKLKFKNKISTEKTSNRALFGSFMIPGNQTITVKNMYYIYYGNGKRDEIIVEILNWPCKNLIWLNQNLPAIQIKKTKTIIYAAPPGVGKRNQIKFMNIGAEPITVQVRIIPYRT